MENFIYFLQGRMETPGWFGWYHILWLGLMVAACVLIYVFRKRISQKAVHRIILISGIVLLVFEVYKQIVYSFNFNGGGGNSTWDYEWYSFPFQFCSTPGYLMVLAGILKPGKVRDTIYSYLATYALFAGLCVMVYPGDVFSSMIGINIHTMVWHAGMVVIAFLILATRSVEFNFKTILKATIVFVIMLILALLMNIIWWHCSDRSETFNMFYISPYYPCTLPLLSILYPMMPYACFLLMYIIGFMLAASIMLGFAILFAKLEAAIAKRRNKNNNSEEVAQTKQSE